MILTPSEISVLFSLAQEKRKSKSPIGRNKFLSITKD
jgi:hypothetical protein